jgi:hypothetical protein
MKQLHVLNLGAGVQSTTLYLMFMKGELRPQLDCAIFADTGEEPAPVYRHLDWLSSLRGPRILIRTIGRLGDHLLLGRNSTGQQFPSIPTHTADVQGVPKGMMSCQCTREYKLEVIEQAIRRELVRLRPREWSPAGEMFVNQYFGLNADEPDRATRVRDRFVDVPWSTPSFPLIRLGMTRADCVAWLKRYGVPHEVPPSACVICPFRKNSDWKWLRDHDPAGFKRAVEIDATLRLPRVSANRNLCQNLYLHRSCLPLGEVSLDNSDSTESPAGFQHEGGGICKV